MISLKTSDSDEAKELVDLFEIDGKVYQIPAKPRANLALKYLSDVEGVGTSIAEVRLLKRLLGDEGFEALSNFDGLDPKDLESIQVTAARLTLGALEEGQEKG